MNDADSSGATADRDRVANDLIAESYLPLADVVDEDAERVLTALTRARVAAYLSRTATGGGFRLFADASERSYARSVLRATGARAPELAADAGEDADTDARFADLTAGWHVDTVSAIRAAQQQLSAEDETWRDHIPVPLPNDEDDPEIIEHYVAPAPPPLPRFAAATLRALAIIFAGIAILIFGRVLDFDPDLTLLLGSAGILVGAGLLVMRLRPDRPEDDHDDGAVL